jgi:hypothetical protein
MRHEFLRWPRTAYEIGTVIVRLLAKACCRGSAQNRVDREEGRRRWNWPGDGTEVRVRRRARLPRRSRGGAAIVGTAARIEDTPIALLDRVKMVNVRSVWLGLVEMMPLMKS